MSSGIYAIRNTRNGIAYVGFSCHLPTRWRHHRANLRSGGHHNKALQAAWNEDGEAQFDFVVLEEVTGHSALVDRERYHFSTFAQTYNGSRLGGGQVGGSYTHPLEVIERLRHANLGKPKSEEHRRKLSLARMGKKFPKHGDALRGRKLSLETRENMRQAHLGIKHTEETRAKCRAMNLGRVFTPEWKAKISAAKRGKPHWSKRIQAELTTEPLK